MGSLSPFGRTLIIIPGLTEGRPHFSRLIKLLQEQGVNSRVLWPWQLEAYQPQNTSSQRYVYLGHSLGAWQVLDLTDKRPAIVVGLVDISQLKRHAFRALNIASWQEIRANSGFFIWLRLVSAFNLLRHPIKYLKVVRQMFERSPSRYDDSEDVLILGNGNDPISIARSVEFSLPGHHEDIVYRPQAYLPHILGLFKS